MNKLRNLLNRRSEEGASELPVTIIMLPFALFLIFALIDVSFYMQTRSSVQNVLRDGVREIALYGGNSSSVPLNTSGKTVAQQVFDNLYQNGQCVKSYCSAPPKVTCTPDIATAVGQTVSCTVTYAYSPVVYDGFFGFSQFVTSPPYTLTETSISETRF